MFKTSGGKWIAPTPIENSLRADPRISQALVCGARRKHVVALIALNRPEVIAWAQSQGLATADWPALVRSPEVQAQVQVAVDSTNAHLASFEAIKRFAILEADFTIEGGELTPSLKVKRKAVQLKHADLIDSLYDEVFDDARAGTERRVGRLRVGARGPRELRPAALGRG